MKLWPVLFVLLIVSTSLVAADAPPGLTPDEAAQSVGQKIVMGGKVSEVRVAENGDVSLNFGGDYPGEIFSVLIPHREAKKFPTFAELAGKTVRVTGTVKLEGDRPRIVLKDPALLEVVEAE